MNDSTEILERVRKSVARVIERVLDDLDPEEKLELDSISRIGVITELENEFEIEFGDDITPECFETLATLTTYVKSIKL
ncbi:MAG: acyl carrier protein [Magnetococcales bacterium]|nr:acyl carrier protein [Magnetococcales bacterium]